MWRMNMPDGSVLTVADGLEASGAEDEESASLRVDNSLESIVQRMIRESEKRTQAKIEKMESRIKEVETMRNRFEVPESAEHYDDSDGWQRIGSESIVDGIYGERAAPAEAEMDEKSFKFEEDVYAILVSAKWNTSPFWFALLVIFLFQTSLSLLLLMDQIDWSNADNPIRIPANVKLEVRLSQTLAIFIALFSQADLLQGIETLFNGVPSNFKGPDDRFSKITTTQWNVTCAVRICQGTLNLFAAFVLLIQSETVFDVLLNFLGVAFVSDLDDMAFQLGASGYFGRKVKSYAITQRETDFYKEGRRDAMVPLIIFQKKIMHIFTSLVILVIMFFFYIYFIVQQNAGVYSIQDMRVEFGDEVLPFMGLLNGCYQVYGSSGVGNDRLIYRQLGFEEEGGKFGFCNDLEEGEGGWTFFVGRIRDPCEDYIIRSGATETFDVLDAISTTKWYTANGLPIDSLEAGEVENSFAECGKKMFDNTRESCETVSRAYSQNPENSVFFGSMNANSSLDSREYLEAALSHPIYYALSDLDIRKSSRLTIFTGRRWVLTDSSLINGLRDIENLTVSDLEDFFYRQEGFNILDQDADWVDFISEAVDAANDEGTPLQLRWYYPRVETNSSVNFPSADLARPEDDVFVCVFCNSVTNPCFHEGKCSDETGYCNCAHGTNGPLCQEKPLGDSGCNSYFNNDDDKNEYDGGDCCGGTCSGLLCGDRQLLTPFGIDFKNTSRISGTDPLGYENCVDPSFATFTLDVRPHHKFNVETNQTEYEFPSLAVECDDHVYMQTPPFKYSEAGNVTQRFVQEIRTLHGVACTLRYLTYRRGSSVFVSFDEQDQPFRTAISLEAPIHWKVPKSKCVLDLFTSEASDFVNLDDLTFVGNDALSDNMCRRLQQQATNIDARDKLFERYAVGILLKAFIDTEVEDFSIPVDWDHCNGWKSDTFSVECDESGRDVLELQISATKVPLNEVRLLSSLEHLSNLESFSLDNAQGLDAMILLEAPSSIGALSKLTSLKLHGLGLEKLPTSIGKLGALTSLDLRFNKLQSLPGEIGSLGALRHLDVDSNNLKSLPTTIGSLMELRSFSLRFNDLVVIPSEVGSLNNLSSLTLESNRLSALPSEIGGLQSLTDLDLDSNLLLDLPSEIGRLSSLEHLNLSSNKLSYDEVIIVENITIENPTNFTDGNSTIGDLADGNHTGSQDLPRMNTTTYLIRNSTVAVSSIPSEIGMLTSMRSLDLSSNDLVVLPSEIGNLGAFLKNLDISSNMLSALPSELGNLGVLEYLDLAANALSSREVTVSNFTLGNVIDNNTVNLQEGLGTETTTNVTIPNTTVVVSSVPSELGRLRSLTALDLSMNDLAILPSELGNLAALKQLNVSLNIISELPSELGNLGALQYMDLSANALSSREIRNITDTDLINPQELLQLNATVNTTMNYTVVVSSLPSTIGQLESLMILDLGSNDLSVLPTEIGTLMALNKLIVQNNTLTALPSEIGGLVDLSFLDVSWNSLSNLPTELGNLANLLHLNLSFNEMLVTWSPQNNGVKSVIGNLETCESDSAYLVSPCALFCCSMGPNFCPAGC